MFPLVLEIDLFNTGGDAGEHFVGNGLEHVAQNRGRQMLAKDFDRVALMDVGNVSHVNHRYIHADITHIGCLLAINQAVASTTTQMAVQAVGIANRDGGNQTVARKDALAAVAHRFVVVAGKAAGKPPATGTGTGPAARGS